MEQVDCLVIGRTIAIGDIHGCHAALALLLSRLEPTADDTFVVLGDIVDRGPSTSAVVDCLLDLGQQCGLVFIRGNHEEMMLDALQGGPMRDMWLSYGGAETLASYGGAENMIPPHHVEFLNSSVDYFETDADIFVHANLEPEIPLDQQTPHALRWLRLTGIESPHHSGKRVICGHSAQMSGLPAFLEGWLCLDTWAYGAGFLTCFDVTNSLFYQAQQGGRYRGGFTFEDLL